MKILICEDHTLLRQNLKKLFEVTPGISFIHEAKNGAQTFDILKKTLIDIVLLDLNLPELHGLVVLDKISEQWPGVKVLILSADPYEESAVKAIQKGAWCYLNKDIDSDILIEAIYSLHKGKKYVLPEILELLTQQEKTCKELHNNLSERQYEVMILLAKEKKYEEIHHELCISVNTVGTHRTNIIRIMGMKKNSELTKYCLEKNLI